MKISYILLGARNQPIWVFSGVSSQKSIISIGIDRSIDVAYGEACARSAYSQSPTLNCYFCTKIGHVNRYWLLDLLGTVTWSSWSGVIHISEGHFYTKIDKISQY